MSRDACILLGKPQLVSTFTFLHKIILSDLLLPPDYLHSCSLLSSPKYSHFENSDEKTNLLWLALIFTICWKSGKWYVIKGPPILESEKLVQYLPRVSRETRGVHSLSLHLSVFIYDMSILSWMTCTTPPNWVQLFKLQFCTSKAH